MPLVLSRRRLQRVVITVPPSATEQRIVVGVAEWDRDKVRLAFSAAGAVMINREEVQDEIDAKAAKAAKAERA